MGEINRLLANGLPLPTRLAGLIERGLWPRTATEERKQNVRCLISKERIQAFAPEHDRIYFVRPPFHTVAKLRNEGQEQFWSTFAAPEGIAPERALFLGDFGLGSDSPILLDYQEHPNNPSVVRLKWRKGSGLPNIWVLCADNFDEFADMLGLEDGGPVESDVGISGKANGDRRK